MSETRRSPISLSFYATLFASTFLFGSSFVAGKVLIAAGVPGMLLAGWRFFVAAFAALPFVLLQQPRSLLIWKIPRREVCALALIGLFQTTGVMALLFTSLQWISASVAAIVMSTAPIWVALAGRLFLGDSMSAPRWFGLVLGVAGVTLAIGATGVAAAGANAPWLGELMCLAASLCWAAATIISKRANLSVSAWALTFWQMLIGSLATLVLAYSFGQRWTIDTTTRQWFWFAWLALPGSTGAFGLWFIALSRGGAIRTSSFLFLAPLFATLLSIVVFGSLVTVWQLVGGVLIGVALWLVNRTPILNEK